MPVLSWGHSHYWQADTAPSTVVSTLPVAGYPAWQTSIILGGGFGAAQTIWEWAVPPTPANRKD